MKIKVGDKLIFKKFNWVITRKIEHISGVTEYFYRVQRKYFKGFVPLYYTKQDYPIFDWRWNFLKKELNKNPEYHYTMHNWANNKK